MAPKIILVIEDEEPDLTLLSHENKKNRNHSVLKQKLLPIKFQQTLCSELFFPLKHFKFFSWKWNQLGCNVQIPKAKTLGWHN